MWPRASEFGFPDEMAAFGLQYGHGVGLSIWEKPIFSRLVSLDHPEPLEEGMVFALETYWPASDGWSAARIEEELVVTADGCEVITKFPAEELLVAGRKYWTAGGQLSSVREGQSHLNTSAGRSERIPQAADGARPVLALQAHHVGGIRRPRADGNAHGSQDRGTRLFITVWNRTPGRSALLAERGARVAKSPQAVTTDCDVFITMVSDGAAATAVWCGAEGMLSARSPGTI
jgi:hypothetical protein